MKVLVDTSVWSLALRRSKSENGPEAAELAALVDEGRVVMIGAIRQELLSGIRVASAFQRLRDQLRAFPDLPLIAGDHEEAADCFNRCRTRGIQGSNTDFLICALSLRHRVAVFTTDKDFERYARVLPFKLHAVRSDERA